MALRRHLAVMCDAPIGTDDDVKYHEMNDKKVVRYQFFMHSFGKFIAELQTRP
jgi:hypothetical protein